MATGDEILAWKKAAEQTPPQPLTNCPVCEWVLNKKDGIPHCPFCGWTGGNNGN